MAVGDDGAGVDVAALRERALASRAISPQLAEVVDLAAAQLAERLVGAGQRVRVGLFSYEAPVLPETAPETAPAAASAAADPPAPARARARARRPQGDSR